MLIMLGYGVLILCAAIALYLTKNRNKEISGEDYAENILKAQENLTKHRDKTKKFPNY